MLDTFINYINDNHLVGDGERIFVALSGGVDSIVLTDLLLRAGYDVTLGHCNFHLRDEESDGDEQFVKAFASERGVSLYVKHFDTKSYARDNAISVEMAARELRYSWFADMAQCHGFHKVAIAHHGDDNIETFFINLLRGSGIQGLKSMKPINGIYIRPLLWANRSMIRDYALQNNLSWRDDHTNDETVFLRNKIRHVLLPTLDGIKENYRQKILFSIGCLSAENDLYRKMLHEKLSSMEYVSSDFHSIKIRDFLEDETGKQLLFEWVRRFGFNGFQCDSMMKSIKEHSKTVFYSSDYQLDVTSDTVEIFKSSYDSDEEYVIDKDCNEILSPLHLSFSVYEKNNDFIIIKDKSDIAQLDYNKLSFPLKLRHWREGDRFFPLGMRGSKLLSDFFNDNAFTPYQKRNTWLLLDNDENILWVVGFRINDKFKIVGDTKFIFKIMLYID